MFHAMLSLTHSKHQCLDHAGTSASVMLVWMRLEAPNMNPAQQTFYLIEFHQSNTTSLLLLCYPHVCGLYKKVHEILYQCCATSMYRQ